jgi:competence protein ComEA
MSNIDGLVDRLRWPLSLVLSALILVGGTLSLTQPSPPPLEVVVPTPVPREVKVYVSGAVARPGVYRVEEGDRVEDALLAAGGASIDADMARLNLASRLHDGMHLQVPFVQSEEGAALPASGGEEALINLNTAPLALLDTLPGVGPVTANRIIDHRSNVGPFQRIEELLETKIVNASTFDKIKGRITAP